MSTSSSPPSTADPHIPSPIDTALSAQPQSSDAPLTSHTPSAPTDSTASTTSLPSLPPAINSLPPLDSSRPVTTNYLPPTTTLPPLTPLPASLASLSPTSLTRSLLDTLHAQTSLADSRHYAHQLHATVTALHARLEQVTLSRAHSVAHLQREILRKEAAINELMTERVGLMREVDSIRQAARDEVAAERERIADKSRRQEAELALIKNNYGALKAFACDKAALEAELTTARAELEAEKTAHNRDVCELERRNVLEKEKMKNSMLTKIRDTKLSLLAQTEDQLSMITKRTMLENQQVITELMYQSKETEKMNERYQAMLEKEKRQQSEAELWKQEKQLMTQQLALCHKLIKQWQQKEKDRQSQSAEEQKEDLTTVNGAPHLNKVNLRGKRASAHAAQS